MKQLYLPTMFCLLDLDGDHFDGLNGVIVARWHFRNLLDQGVVVNDFSKDGMSAGRGSIEPV